MKTRTILYADEGKILTDGKIYGSQIFLEENRNIEEFYEISQEMYDILMEEQLRQAEIKQEA